MINLFKKLDSGLRRNDQKARKKPVKSDPEYIHIAEHDIHIRLTTHARARRYILKQDIKNGGFILTRPPRGSFRAAEKFAYDHLHWMLKHQVEKTLFKKFEDGDVFHFYDTPLKIENDPRKLRGLPHITDNTILHVPGHAQNMHRKICDFLKDDFRRKISAMAHQKSARIGKTIRRIRIADQKTRWGSCSSNGTLSFSARLVFAPDFVLDYIAAHEVAHMIHMDHSADFWALCDDLCDHEDMHAAKHWLKTSDHILMTYALN